MKTKTPAEVPRLKINLLKMCSCREKKKTKQSNTLLRKLQTFVTETLKSSHFGRKLLDTLSINHTKRLNENTPAVKKAKEIEMYNRYQIISTHPGLNSRPQCINVKTFIFREAPKKTARFYAGLLWNLKQTDMKICTNHFIQRCLHLCIKYMDLQDFQFIKTHLQRREQFQALAVVHDATSIRSYLWSTLKTSDKSISILVETIHNWFLCMPILLELAKLTSWNFLHENQASLLGVDTLYGILINAAYNKKSNNM